MTAFYYGFEEKDYHDAAASFDNVHRLMKLAPDFDPDGDADNLVLFHELFHAYWDIRIRTNIEKAKAWDSYDRLNSYGKNDRPKFDLLNESYATAYEIIALNILTDGYIKRQVLKGLPIDNANIAEKLNAKKISQKGPLAHTLSLVESFFKPGEKYMGYPKDFVHQIAMECKKRGYFVWVQENGKIIPYFKSDKQDPTL
jgi:hypothetical protein